MEDINIVSATIQAALFSLVSTSLAQLISAWRQPTITFELSPFVTFASVALLPTPPNLLFQSWLERSFPTLVPDNSRSQHDRMASARPSAEMRRCKTNILTKFILDQTLGAAANTAAFIALTAMFKGYTYEQIGLEIQAHFVELFVAGWRMWPFVSFANMSFVPLQWRPMVGNTAGLCWGVYLALMSS